MPAIPLSALCLFPPTIRIELDGNPWQCDCRMAPVRLIPAFKDQITCAQPAKVQGQKLAHVDPKELICKEPTSHYHWYFKFNAVPESDPDSTSSPAGKTRATQASPLAITSDKQESAPSPPLPDPIRPSFASVAGIVLIVTFAVIWNKRRTRNPPLGLNPGVVVSNKNTAASIMADGHDHRGQGQSKAITESNTNYCTATVMTSGDHQYQNIDNPRDKTGQGQSQDITASTTKTTATVMASGDDHQYEDIDSNHVKTGQDQSQTIIESKTNNTATVMSSGHGRKGQGQSQPTTELFDVRNLSYGTGPPVSHVNSHYTATGVTSGNVQTRQGQYEAITKSLDARNHSYGTRPTASKLNTLYKTATVMSSDHDQTGQGQSQTTSESNTNTTATGMTKGHGNIGQGQSQANAQSPTVANLSRSEVLAALQPNPMYADVKTPTKDEASTEIASGHDQTGQGQSQANIQHQKVGNLSHNEVLAALQPNPMYADVKTPTKDEASTEIASGHDQTGQGQSQANIQHQKVGNLSHNEVLAALQPNPMYADVKTPTKDEASTEIASGHDQTGQGQSQANIQHQKVGNLSHNEVLAALQSNTTYVDVKTPTKN
ncbi:Bax inhibitor 1 [Branchiostoma belcheri]|nr:Bax inhibitor 1 [Branchiostoma belcheri]